MGKCNAHQLEKWNFCARFQTFCAGEHCRFFEEEKPMTNADHIRSMSDEELAKELIWIQQDAYTLGDRMRNIDDSKYPLSKAEWMEWLSEPYKEKEE